MSFGAAKRSNFVSEEKHKMKSKKFFVSFFGASTLIYASLIECDLCARKYNKYQPSAYLIRDFAEILRNNSFTFMLSLFLSTKIHFQTAFHSKLFNFKSNMQEVVGKVLFEIRKRCQDAEKSHTCNT